MRRVLQQLKKANIDYQLIEPNDRIAIGISGGKDSTVLLYVLHEFKKMRIVPFDIVPIHLKLGFPDMDMSPMVSWCDSLGTPLVMVDTDVYEILKLHPQPSGKLPCSLCSKFKKGYVIDEAKKLGCNKIAFAHHGDDAIETVFLNMIYGGRIATFKPKMYMSRTDIHFIRPLLYVYESDIVATVEQCNLPVVTSTCPNDKHTQREVMKDLIKSIKDDFPSAKHNLLSMLSNDKQVDLWSPIRKNGEEMDE